MKIIPLEIRTPKLFAVSMNVVSRSFASTHICLFSMTLNNQNKNVKCKNKKKLSRNTHFYSLPFHSLRLVFTSATRNKKSRRKKKQVQLFFQFSKDMVIDTSGYSFSVSRFSPTNLFPFPIPWDVPQILQQKR